MKPKTFAVLSVAIGEGVRMGWRLAFRDNDSPDESQIIESLHREVMNSISDYFDLNKE